VHYREAIEKERKRKQHQEAYASGKTAEVRHSTILLFTFKFFNFFFEGKT
jgi:hypothetical protein